MIDRVHFENFKSLRDVTIDLGRFTALVGPTGCGKSSMLQGMHLLSLTGVKASTDRDPEAPWGRFASIYNDPRTAQRWIHRDCTGTMLLGMRHRDGDELRVVYMPHAEHSDRSAFQVVVDPAPHLRCALPPPDPSSRRSVRRSARDGARERRKGDAPGARGESRRAAVNARAARRGEHSRVMTRSAVHAHRPSR
jgi:energy-coupling factor transporter ATP-binding protein EcfA2